MRNVSYSDVFDTKKGGLRKTANTDKKKCRGCRGPSDLEPRARLEVVRPCADEGVLLSPLDALRLGQPRLSLIKVKVKDQKQISVVNG